MVRSSLGLQRKKEEGGGREERGERGREMKEVKGGRGGYGMGENAPDALHSGRP
jgi:hypothetical protein